ncbi:MAG: hypothetical protein JO041_15440, partial [Acidobacteria bacterium]|nr:hypothetical protein [Acidobacteriota bacterium]
MILISLPEFLILWGLWMAFVSNSHVSEMIVGGFAALGAAIADGVVKERRIVEFLPRASWVWLILLEPWYAVDGTWAIFAALAKRLMGRPSEAQF